MPGAQVWAGGPASCRRRRVEVEVGGLVGDLVVDGLAEEVLLDPVGQARDADPEQPDAAGGVEVLEQGDGEPADGDRGVGGGAERGRAADRGEVVEADLDGDGAAGQAARPQPLGDVAGLPGQQGRHQPAVGEVGVVGALDADRLGLALGHDRPVVAGVGQLVEGVAVGAAEHPDQLVLADRLEVGDGVDAGAPQPLGGRGADAGDDRHVHRPEEVGLGAGWHDDEAVGLVEVAGHLGDELRGADPDRRSQPTRGLGDLLTKPLGERRDRGDLQVGQARGGQVDERLVQRQRLHQRGGLAQHRHHQLAAGAVGVEAAAQERRVGAPRACLAGRHRRPDAVLACLVRRRGDHPAPADAADHDRLAAQRRLVALLDGREERVEVEVQHRRDRTHGRNVAPGTPWAAGARAARLSVSPRWSVRGRRRARSSRGRPLPRRPRRAVATG